MTEPFLTPRQALNGVLLLAVFALALAVASAITDDVPRASEPEMPAGNAISAAARLQCRADELDPLLDAIEERLAERELERQLFPEVDP